MASNLEFHFICRACLSKSGSMSYLFSENTPEMFKYCTSIEVSMQDSLPNQICQSCLSLLNKFYYFKQEVARCDKLLKQQSMDQEKVDNCVIEVSDYNDAAEFSDVVTTDAVTIDDDVAKDAVAMELPDNRTSYQVETQKKLKKHQSRRTSASKQVKTKKTWMKCAKSNKGFLKYGNFESHMRNHYGKKVMVENCVIEVLDYNDEAEFSDVVTTDAVSMDDDVLKDVVSMELPDNEKSYQEEKQKKLENCQSRRSSASKQGKKKKTWMKCAKCNKGFLKYENFEAHMRNHFGKKPDIKCEYCGKTFPALRSLTSHVRTHTRGRNYQCLMCGKKFAYLNVLKNHEMIHMGIKNHECHLCDAKFTQPYNLKSHLATHTNFKNFACAECGKQFSQAGNLKTHLIRHTGIKNVACTVCNMRFFVKGDLYKHMASHSLDKPFACEHCDKTFKNKSFLIIHMRTHTGERPYACDICPKKFMSQKDMRNHRMIHTGEKPHKCQLCNQAFIQKSALNRHLKGHEREDKAQGLVIRPQIQVQSIRPTGVSYTWCGAVNDIN